MSEFNPERLRAELESLEHWQGMTWIAGNLWSGNPYSAGCPLCKFTGYVENFREFNCFICPILLSGQVQCTQGDFGWRRTMIKHDTSFIIAVLRKTIAWELSLPQEDFIHKSSDIPTWPDIHKVLENPVKPILPPDFPKWEPKVGSWWVVDGQAEGYSGFTRGEIGVIVRLSDNERVRIYTPHLDMTDIDLGFSQDSRASIPDLPAYLKSHPDTPNFEAVIRYLLEKGEK